MDGVIPIIISVIALLLTLYQLYLQRVHDEKSLKPLAQIDLMDRDGLLFVHVTNNGVGPMIIEKLIFQKGGQQYLRIQDCLDADPKSYDHIEITAANKKVVLPGGYLEVFSKQFSERDKEAAIAYFRQQLSGILLRVEGRDIYDNKVILEKSLRWFVRHSEMTIADGTTLTDTPLDKSYKL